MTLIEVLFFFDSTIAVYYSAGYGLLQKVVKTRTNDATGKGQGEFSMVSFSFSENMI